VARILIGACLGGLAGCIFALAVLALFRGSIQVLPMTDQVVAVFAVGGWVAGSVAGSLTETARALIQAIGQAAEAQIEALGEATKTIVHAVEKTAKP